MICNFPDYGLFHSLFFVQITACINDNWLWLTVDFFLYNNFLCNSLSICLSLCIFVHRSCWGRIVRVLTYIPLASGDNKMINAHHSIFFFVSSGVLPIGFFGLYPDWLFWLFVYYCLLQSDSLLSVVYCRVAYYCWITVECGLLSSGLLLNVAYCRMWLSFEYDLLPFCVTDVFA